MFQYAFARKLSIESGEKIYLDRTSYIRDPKRQYELDKYNIVFHKGKYINIFVYNIILRFEKFLRLGLTEKGKIQTEKNVLQVQIIEDATGFFCGQWQNEEYFKSIRNNLLKEFQYLGNISLKEKEMIQKIRSENAVAMHIRRGDYLTKECQNNCYIPLEKNYYTRALTYLHSHVNDLKIYIFSDDIDWCKSQYIDLNNTIFIDEKVSSGQQIDFELMRNCKYFIIANSTYSWWASWLATFEQKIVIAPKKWFGDNEEFNLKIRQALLKNAIVL